MRLNSNEALLHSWRIKVMQKLTLSYLATGERTTEKKSESQAGIEPTTSVTPVECSNL